MSDEISIADIVITWFLFWVLTLVGLVLFAGCILVPLWQNENLLALEYQAVSRQVDGLKKQVDQVNEQLGALWVDPEYTERIARNELNLRKTGEETLVVRPVPVIDETTAESDGQIAPDDRPRDFSKQWWYKPFLDTQKRTYLIYLAAALVATGLIVAIAGKDRRLQALGF